MELTNFPKSGELPTEGKTYWRLAIGHNAVPYRMFDGGWRAFEFFISKPYPANRDPGEVLEKVFRLAFAYWLPIQFL